MNYELAKKLKDGGFLQNLNGNGRWIDSQGEDSMMLSYQKVYVPTLSELIEACGNNFGSLKQYMDCTNGGYKYMASKLLDSNVFSFQNNTPEEAVANLWLSLNSKN